MPRVQLAILWAGIESLFRINNELSFRISLYIAKEALIKGPSNAICNRNWRQISKYRVTNMEVLKVGRNKKAIPQYGTVKLNGIEYYRTRIEDADGKRVALYAKTAEELYEKVEEAKRQIKDAVFRRSTPTVEEYCEKWLKMQSARIRVTTLTDHSSKVKNYIVAPLGDKYMAEVTADDVKMAMVPVVQKSSSVYRSVNMLFKCIFNSAVESNIIDVSPCQRVSAKGGKPQKDRESLTDEQVEKLLAAIKGLPRMFL